MKPTPEKDLMVAALNEAWRELVLLPVTAGAYIEFVWKDDLNDPTASKRKMTLTTVANPP